MYPIRSANNLKDSHRGYENQNGKLGSKNVSKYVPASHSDFEKIVMIGLLSVGAILVASIIFWAVGASTNIAGLEIVGKVFFGLTISAIGITLLALAAFVFTQNQGNSGPSFSMNFRA